MKFFNRTLVFDFGSANTVVCEDEKVVFDERTTIAIMSDGDIYIGNRACAFFSCDYELIMPIKDGVVVNAEAYEKFVKALLKKLMWFPRLCLRTVVVAIPNEMIKDGTLTEAGRMLCEPFRKMGVKEIKEADPKGSVSCVL